MEEKIWIIHDSNTGYNYAYNNINALKMALGDIIYCLWENNNHDLTFLFGGDYRIEEIPLNKNLP